MGCSPSEVGLATVEELRFCWSTWEAPSCCWGGLTRVLREGLGMVVCVCESLDGFWPAPLMVVAVAGVAELAP
jgi:hypothetical protein